MSGETDLQKLLQNMQPQRNPGEYVFCLQSLYEAALALRPLCIFLEKEGATVILPRQQADRDSLPYSLVCAW